MQVQLVIERDSYFDHLYESGFWQRAEIKNVPAEMAQRLLRHNDVWGVPVAIAGDAATAQEVVPAAKQPPEELLEDDARLHDRNVQTMTKGELVQYAAMSFKHALDATTKIQDMRSKVKQLRELAGIRRGAH